MRWCRRQRLRSRLRDGAQPQGFRLLEESRLGALDLRMLRFSFPPRLDGQGAIMELEALDASATAGVNHIYRPAALNDPGALSYANALIEWPDGGCRARGPVGVIDSGVDPDLAARGGRIISKSFVRGAAGSPAHGTDVASVLLDPVRLSRVTLFDAAVIGQSNESGVDSLLKAIDWMAENRVRLVNISLAGPYNKLLDRGVAAAARNGMVIVAAVGNEGASAPPRYPAAFDAVIAVTAVDADQKIFRSAVRGPHVDIAAPGVDILVQANGSQRFVSGTSMAAPFVTARILSDAALFGRDAAGVRAILAQGAQDLGPPGADRIFGSGLMLGAETCAR